MSNSSSFITNENQTHKEVLTELLKEADEIIFAVGFLKMSGYNNIKKSITLLCKNKSTKAKFFIGTGFGETAPIALQSLYKLIKRNSNYQLILCTPKVGIFHPKIYVFRKGSEVTIITGSANLTEAGWLGNDEVSLRLKTTVDSHEYIQLTEYFERLYKVYFIEELDEILKKYNADLKKHRSRFKNDPKFRFDRKINNIAEIDWLRLEQYYEQYKKSNEFIEPEEREAKYRQAKLNLEEIASSKNMSRQEFHNLFGPLAGHSGYIKLWHSGNIHRKTHKTLDYIPAFRELVRFIGDNINEQPALAYDNVMDLLKQKRKQREIMGIGQNIVAEIMMSYDFTKFANINVNPISVLALLGKEFKSINSFLGEDYEEYVKLLSQIKGRLNMNSFLEIDSFFNYVYWNILEE